MAFFRRKSEVIEEVPELEQYYAERRTGNVWGWVMALVTMALTVLIIVGLFYGGRWVYRELNNQDAAKPTVTAPANPSDSKEISGVTSLPSDEPSSATRSDQSSAGSTTNPTGPTTNTTNTSNNTSGTQTQIPDTGPGEIFAIALIAVVCGYLLRAKMLAQKINN